MKDNTTVNFGLCCLFKEEKIQYKTYTKFIFLYNN